MARGDTFEIAAQTREEGAEYNGDGNHLKEQMEEHDDEAAGDLVQLEGRVIDPLPTGPTELWQHCKRLNAIEEGLQDARLITLADHPAFLRHKGAGLHHSVGTMLFSTDAKRAVRHLNIAADLGHLRAQGKMGEMLVHLKIGGTHSKNAEERRIEGLRWLERAAAQGHARAIELLATSRSQEQLKSVWADALRSARECPVASPSSAECDCCWARILARHQKHLIG